MKRVSVLLTASRPGRQTLLAWLVSLGGLALFCASDYLLRWTRAKFPWDTSFEVHYRSGWPESLQSAALCFLFLSGIILFIRGRHAFPHPAVRLLALMVQSGLLFMLFVCGWLAYVFSTQIAFAF